VRRRGGALHGQRRGHGRAGPAASATHVAPAVLLCAARDGHQAGGVRVAGAADGVRAAAPGLRRPAARRRPPRAHPLPVGGAVLQPPAHSPRRPRPHLPHFEQTLSTLGRRTRVLKFFVAICFIRNPFVPFANFLVTCAQNTVYKFELNFLYVCPAADVKRGALFALMVL
jgi:hypothetical protein